MKTTFVSPGCLGFDLCCRVCGRQGCDGLWEKHKPNDAVLGVDFTDHMTKTARHLETKRQMEWLSADFSQSLTGPWWKISLRAKALDETRRGQCGHPSSRCLVRACQLSSHRQQTVETSCWHATPASGKSLNHWGQNSSTVLKEKHAPRST